jgi:thioredoxin reductase (NADPH)
MYNVTGLWYHIIFRLSNGIWGCMSFDGLIINKFFERVVVATYWCACICLVCALFSPDLACENSRFIMPVDRTKKTKKATQSKSMFDIKKIRGLEEVIPVVILGAGPGGLSAGLYAAAQFDTVVIAGPEPSLLAETSYVENWLGAPHQLGADLIQKSREQAESLGVRVIDAAVEKLDLQTWPFVVTLDDGKKLHALSLVLATGARPKLLGVPGEKEYWAMGVSACARCDAAFYKNKKVVVIGGGDVAIEQAIELSRYAQKVSIVYRGSQLRAINRMQKRLKLYDGINVIYNTEVREIIGDKKNVTGIKVVNNVNGTEETLPVDGVFLAVGHRPNTDLFKDILETDEQGFLVVQFGSQQTSMPGVFAAGDVADPHYRQAIIAAGDGAKAAINAIEFLESIGFNKAETDKLRALRAERKSQSIKAVHDGGAASV